MFQHPPTLNRVGPLSLVLCVVVACSTAPPHVPEEPVPTERQAGPSITLDFNQRYGKPVDDLALGERCAKVRVYDLGGGYVGLGCDGYTEHTSLFVGVDPSGNVLTLALTESFDEGSMVTRIADLELESCEEPEALQCYLKVGCSNFDRFSTVCGETTAYTLRSQHGLEPGDEPGLTVHNVVFYRAADLSAWQARIELLSRLKDTQGRHLYLLGTRFEGIRSATIHPNYSINIYPPLVRPADGAAYAFYRYDGIEPMSANALCAASGGHLATPANDGEREVVMDLLRAHPLKSSAWLGAKRCALGDESQVHVCRDDNGNKMEFPMDHAHWIRNGMNAEVGAQLYMLEDGRFSINTEFARDGVGGFICEWD